MALLETALWYAEHGFSVLPIHPMAKNPMTEHGAKEASSNREQIVAWWTNEPKANIGISTDGLLVVDIDSPSSKWLEGSILKKDLESAPTISTPRGGSHHYFRQVNTRLGNTVKKLNCDVDTRGYGGYVLAPPSRTKYGFYQQESEDVLAFHKCPELPPWLYSLLTTVQSQTLDGDEPQQNSLWYQVRELHIPSGTRNEIMFRLGCSLRKSGLSVKEIYDTLRSVNVHRCAPPLDDREVRRIAESAGSKDIDQFFVAMVEDLQGRLERKHNTSETMSLDKLISGYPSMRKPLIHNLLRRGETMNVVAPPKTGKSWMVMALTASIATGRHWLGEYLCEQGRVLMIDNELHPETLANRFPRVLEQMEIDMATISDRIDIKCMRGQLRDINSLQGFFEKIQAGQYDAVVLDAMYRFLPRDTDENSNADITQVYNTIDRLADSLNSAFITVHHTSKGNQSAKGVTDVGAGAGSQARTVDCHTVLREHEEPGVLVMDIAVRSWPNSGAVCLEREGLIWKANRAKDATLLKKETGKRKPKVEEPPAAKWTPLRFAQELITATVRHEAEIFEGAEGQLSQRELKRLLQVSVAKGYAYEHQMGGGQKGYANVPPQISLEAGKTARAMFQDGKSIAEVCAVTGLKRTQAYKYRGESSHEEC